MMHYLRFTPIYVWRAAWCWLALLLCALGVSSLGATAADASNAPYLPLGLSYQKLDSETGSMPLELGQMNLAKLMLKPGSSYDLQRYWTDKDWGLRYYLPLRSGGSVDSYRLMADPGSGSHLELSASFRQQFGDSGQSPDAGHHHLLAARFENLPSMSGYYPHDFESKICLYSVKRDFSQVYLQRFLNLVKDNPHLGTAHRVRPGTTGWPKVLEAYDQEAVVPPSFKVGSSVAGETSKLDGYDGGLDGDVEMAFDGLRQTAYRSSGANPRLVVDLGAEYPVDRIVIRWQGDTAQDYRLYTFTHGGHHTSIRKILKRLDAGKVDERKHLIYSGRVNAELDYAVIQSSASVAALTVENNNTVSTSEWVKTRSYYASEPNLLSLSGDVTEVVQLPLGSSAAKVRFVVFEGISQSDGAGGIKPFQIRELEVYGYPVLRHQCGNPRLFNYRDKPWLLYDATLSGRPVDPVADGGQGRVPFLARISYRSDRRGDGVYGPNYFVHMDHSSQATIRRLQLPTGDANHFYPQGAPPPDCQPLPFEGQPGGAHAGKLLLVYDLDPFTVYEVDPDSGQLSEVSQRASNLMQVWGEGKLGAPINATPAIWDATRQQYLCAFQSRLHEPYTDSMGTQTVQRYRRTDYLGLLAFEERSDGSFELAAVTPQPLLDMNWYPQLQADGSRELLPCGLAADPDVAGNYRLSMGVAGRQVQVAQLGADVLDVLTALEPDSSSDSVGPLDVYVVLGLSNAAGRAPVEAQDVVSSGAVYLLNADHAWEAFSEPSNSYSNIRHHDVRQQLGPAGSFGRALRASPGDVDKQIGLVVNARGGGSLREWLKVGDDRFEGIDSDGVGRYEQTVARIQAALDAGAGHQLKGIVILAGEGDLDSDQAVSEYASVFQALVDDLRMESFANPTLPVVTSLVLEDSEFTTDLPQLRARETRKAALNRAIATLEDDDPYLTVAVPTSLSSMGDGMHYNSGSMRYLGILLAEAMDTLAYPLTPDTNIYENRESFYYSLQLNSFSTVQSQGNPVWTANPVWDPNPVYAFDPASIPEFSLSFAADPDQHYGYDDWTNASRPWKSVALGDNDTVLAQIKLGLADYYSDVSFSTNDSAIATVKVPSVENMHQLVKLTVSGVAKGQVTVKGAIEEASVAVAADHVLLLAVYPKKTYTLCYRYVLLPGQQAPTGAPYGGWITVSELEAFINKVYSKAALEFKVMALDPIEVDYDLNGNKGLDLVNYGDDTVSLREQSLIIEQASNSSFDYNVFIVEAIHDSIYGVKSPIDLTWGIANVPGRNIFVAEAVTVTVLPFEDVQVLNTEIVTATAHELGHNLGLDHVGGDDLYNVMYPELSNALIVPMDQLRKWQWDRLNP